MRAPNLKPHGRFSLFLGEAARLPLLRRLRRRPLVDRIVSAHYYAQPVEEVLRFTARELRGHGVARYRPRNSHVDVFIRHGTSDVFILGEVFGEEVYSPPPDVRLRVGERRAPRIVDLGAHIGLFGAYAYTLFPGAEVLAVEADPANAGILRRCAASLTQWTVLEAFAGNRSRFVRFAAGRYAESRTSDRGDVSVPAIDVLPLLAEADLVKIDVEGAEWEILTDPRIAAVRAPVVLEYHPLGCPGEDSRETAIALLGRAHVLDVPMPHAPAGVGVLWAWGERLASP